MNIFFYPFSPWSAFVPYGTLQLEKTLNYNKNIAFYYDMDILTVFQQIQKRQQSPNQVHILQSTNLNLDNQQPQSNKKNLNKNQKIINKNQKNNQLKNKSKKSKKQLKINQNNRNIQQLSKNIKKTSTSITDEIEDIQYHPYERISKKQTNSKLNQNRNILPNTIHQLFSYGQRKNKSGEVVDRIIRKLLIQKNRIKVQEQPSFEMKLMNSAQYQQEQCQQFQQNPIQFNTSRFYIYQKSLKNKIGNYVTEQTLKLVCLNLIRAQLFSQQQQFFYNKVFRILITEYLKHEANCSVLMSKRMYNNKKIQHIKINRYIVDRMKKRFKNQDRFNHMSEEMLEDSSDWQQSA